MHATPGLDLSPFQAPTVIQHLLRTAKTIAIVGLSEKPDRPSHQVAAYLQAAGYRIIPVTPRTEPILGEKTYPDLRSVPIAIDLVDVFRRPDDLVAVTHDAIAAHAPAIWYQLALVHPDAIRLATSAGLTVVVDRCTKIEHARLQAGS